MPVELPIQTLNPADNYNQRSLGEILWAEVPDAFGAVSSLNAAAPFNFTDIHTTGSVIFNNNGAAAGYIWASLDVDGTGEWTSPASIVPGGLVGPPFTIQGVGAFTPQIQAEIVGADQVAFNNFHNAATDTAGSLKYNGGAYRGAIGAMDFLQTGDLIYSIYPLVPFDATTWTLGSAIEFSVPSGHSAGVYPIRVDITANEKIQLTATDDVNVVSAANVGITGGTVSIDGNATAGDDLTVLGDFETQGDAHLAQDAQIDGLLTVDGLITGNAGATIQQPGTGNGVNILARVDDTTDGALAIRSNAATTDDTTAIAQTVIDKAGLSKFALSFAGDMYQRGQIAEIGAANTDSLTFASAAPTFTNIAAQTPDTIAVFSSGKVLGTTGLNTFSRQLFFDATEVSNGASETDLFSQTIAGGTLAADGDGFNATCALSFTASANTKRVRAYFGGTTLVDTGAVIVAGGNVNMSIHVVRTGATTQKATVVFIWASDTTPLTVQTSFSHYSTPAETLSGNVTFRVTGEGTAGEITGRYIKGIRE